MNAILANEVESALKKYAIINSPWDGKIYDTK